MITGGCGFIGSAFVLRTIAKTDADIVNLDCLTYAANLESLASVSESGRYIHEVVDIVDEKAVDDAFFRHKPDAIVNFAAETHVDRSIHGPRAFVETNVLGTLNLLESAKNIWTSIPEAKREQCRFLQISTDEVYGTLRPEEPAFTEQTAYAPSSPYAASKAAADHLVRAFGKTYGLPTLITNCSNNFGPRQFPEKLIPYMIVRALAGESLPLYGDGLNVRDWLHVDDHCDAIWCVLRRANAGSTYNIGANAEIANVDLVMMICGILDELRPREKGFSYCSQIEYVKDRPGHDRRYAINSTKLMEELGWSPTRTFEHSLRETILWYLDNYAWVERIVSGNYRDWEIKHYSAMTL